MAVHDVDVDHPRAGREHLVHLLAEAGEVRRQDRRRDPALAQQAQGRRSAPSAAAATEPQTARSMLPWQWLQATIAVLDMRTIVECSPQFGHTETSS